MPHSATLAPRATRVPSISCVLPAYNEGRNLAQVVPQVLASLQALSPRVEILIINDGSRDDTAAVARALCAAHPGVVLIDLSRNFGKEAALSAVLDAARGEVVVLMDADGQHPAAMLPRMLEKWQQGSDVVYAVRRTRDDQSALHARLAHLFYRLVNWGSKVHIPADAGDFRWMDRKVVEALNTLPERNRFMKGLYAWVGFQSTALDYQPLPRTQGKSSFGLRSALSLALTGMVAFSSMPLRALSLLGLLLSLVALGYGLWVVGEYFWLGIAVPGYATLAAGMMLLSGIQLLSIGVLAEYVGRIYEEVKRRPSYLVSERSGAGLPPGRRRPAWRMSVARTGFWFLAVGGTAALTHMAVFALAQHWLWPEAANALGFGVAFFVSFAGHRRLSFHGAGTTLAQSLARFGATALAGFAVNELVFVLLLRVAGWPSWLALVTAMVLAAGQTFLLSRLWAFRR